MDEKGTMISSLPDLLKTTYGEKIKAKLLKDLAGSTEIRSFLLQESAPFSRLMAYYRCALMEVETKFRVLNEELSLANDRNPIESIKSRIKTPESIIEKTVRKDIPFSTDSIEKNLNDIAGLRVICAFPEDIYLLADCLLSQDDITLVEKKDYIKNPKENGYRSLHLIVEVPIFLQHEKRLIKVEVQLRTIAMDFWASLEHRIKYKKEISENVDLDSISEELKECATESARLDAKMDAIRKRIGD